MTPSTARPNSTGVSSDTAAAEAGLFPAITIGTWPQEYRSLFGHRTPTIR